MSDAATPTSTAFAKGDRVNWNHRPVAGYGFSQSVAGVVRKMGAKRVQIEVRRRPSYGRTPSWIEELKWVEPRALSSRCFPCEAFGEPMEVRVGPFMVKGWRHPSGVSTQFPHGVWYGEVDGFQCTAPCYAEEDALRSAHSALVGGGYRVAVLSGIEVREHWVATRQDQDGKGASELPDLRARLKKVEDWLSALGEDSGGAR